MFRTEWSRDRRADGFSGHVRLRTPTSFRVVAIDKPSKKQERLLPRTCVTLSRNATPFATTGGNPRSGNRRRLCLVRCKGNHVDATETCLSSITLAHYETEKLGQATSAKTRPPLFRQPRIQIHDCARILGLAQRPGQRFRTQVFPCPPVSSIVDEQSVEISTSGNGLQQNRHVFSQLEGQRGERRIAPSAAEK
jgi:hypothetical protein